MSDEAIRYRAQVFKIQTLIDGGLRLTLDLVEPIDTQAIVQLLAAKQPGIILECASVVIDEESQFRHKKNRDGKT
jgi:hypothetical protein